MPRIHVVGGAILQGGKVLAALRSETMSHPGVWEFPGGKVEPGESPEACLVRELREELEVEVEVAGLVARGVSIVDGRRIVLDVYGCRILSGVPVPREHSELRWVGSELDELGWAEADLPAVDALKQRLRGPGSP